ncbi:MAG: imidazolonepropionase [Bacilli bacterium]|nr:imidazolonepropionase [Bacilli bacterium]
MLPVGNKIVFYDIGVLYSLEGPSPRRGKDMGKLLPLLDAYLVVGDGKVIEVGVGSDYQSHQDAKLISLNGKMVLPGFIDSHTHLVHGGSRETEMRRKLQGESYLEILKSGGGILNTVYKTRAANFEDLYYQAKASLKRMLAFGVTSLEAKSGYGLDLETEIKQLEVGKTLNENEAQTIVSTFMGAHALPLEYQEQKQAYLDKMLKVLELVREKKLAKYTDIFCEEGVFSIAESKSYLEAAKKLGFGLKIHADEMVRLGGTKLAILLEAISAEHLIAASDEDLKALGKSKTIGVLLPMTSFYLNKPFAKARLMLDYGAALAIASDYNPGSCPSENLQLAMQIAVLKMRLTPEEVLSAVTINAAAAIGLENTKGSLTPGKDADFIVLDAPNLDYFFYRFGINLVSDVYIKGEKKI